MVRCASLFSQLVALFSRGQFYHLVKEHRAERYGKGYSSWDHFVAMLFCQLAQAKSLREICGGLACTMGKLRHLGMKDAPNKSTLSYANAHRPWEMFRDLFYATLDLCKAAAPEEREVSLQEQAAFPGQHDHRPVPLSFPLGGVPTHQGGRQAPPACWIMMGTFRPMPIFPTGRSMMSPLPGKSRFLQVRLSPWIGATMTTNSLPPGRKTASTFVTRMKDNADYTVVEERTIPITGNVLSDQLDSVQRVLCPKKLPPHPAKSGGLG